MLEFVHYVFEMQRLASKRFNFVLLVDLFW